MQIGMSVIGCSCVYLILLAINYFRKERINTFETHLYSVLLILNIIGLVLEFLCCITVSKMDIIPLINSIVNRLYLIYFVSYITIFTVYVWNASFSKVNIDKNDMKKKNNFINIFFAFIFCVSLVLVLILPLYYFNSLNSVYSYGPATEFLTILCAVYMVVDLYCMLRNLKNIRTKKNIPLFALLFFFAISFIVRNINPSIILINSSFALVTAIMYFTIENPDVKMIEELNIAKIAAEKANRAKSDFLSSMSHEIRTPLNAIVGFSEMIQTENTVEGCKENAKDIVTASQTLLEIVNGILDISKIEANKMEVVNKEYHLMDELNSLAKLIIPRIGDKPIELKTNFAPDIPHTMYGDIGKIKQIITNILTNAAKYTEEGEINFNVKCINQNDNCSLIISIEDTGRGIKPEKINTLFTKFNRLDEDKNTTIEGTGLGLAITKSFVEMMGGKILVQSKYGVGSVFTIYLNQKIVDSSTKIEEKKEEILSFSGTNILVVDDNKLNLKVIDKILKSYSITTTLIDDPEECINLIKTNNKYDLIFMDDMMPKLRGGEVLNKLKEIEGFNIPTIALTANALTGIRESYIKAGFSDYLAKPIEKEELIRVLNQFLNKNVINNDSNKNIIENKPTNYLNKKILVVDDNKINLKVACKLLSSYNFIIEEAYSGFECIDKVKNNKYDLIFMDYMMPNMDGIETLNKLKEISNLDTEIIVLTAEAVEGSREKFISAGFDDYLAKPIDKIKLDEMLKKHINMENTTNQTEINNIQFLKSNNIDVEKGIELLGDIDTYNETIKCFFDEIKLRIEKLMKYKDTDLPNYAIEVHALKSDSKYLGFTTLAELAYEHELKSKANDLKFVQDNFNILMKELGRILFIVNKYIK